MRKLLVVDDEALQRLILTRTIREHLGADVEVLEAANGAEAVEAALGQDIPLVLMDLNMPILNGLEASRRIMAARPHTKILILTAYDEFRFAQEAVKLGAVNYLLKPVEATELNAALRQALAQVAEEEDARQRERELRARLEQALPLIAMEYVHELIATPGAAAGELEARARLLGLAAPPSLVISLSWSEPGPTGQLERELGRQQAMDRLRSLLPAGVALASPAGGGSATVVVAPPEGTDVRRYALDLAGRLVRGMQGRGQRAAAGVSREAEKPGVLATAYSEALRARAYSRPGQVLHVDDIEAGPAVGMHPEPEAEQELLHAVRLGDADRAERAARALRPGLVGLLGAPQVGARLSALQFMLSVARAAGESGARPEDMECFQLRAAEALQGTTEADTVADLLVEGAPRLARAVAESRNSRNLTLVRKALAYMEREYARDISLDEIAAVVHLSPYYFSHVFKEETGVTFVERLTSIRMLHARRLLTTTDWPVTAVAKATGYRDLNYFCRVFKRYVGQTPRRYRQQHQI